MIADWIETGRIVELILVWIAIEAAVLVFLLRARPSPARWVIARGSLRGLLCNLAAGGCLLLAFRAMLAETGVLWVGLWLSLALAAHLVDLGERLRRPSTI